MAFLAREGALWATLCDERRDPFREIAAGWLKRYPEQVQSRAHPAPAQPRNAQRHAFVYVRCILPGIFHFQLSAPQTPPPQMAAAVRRLLVS